MSKINLSDIFSDLNTESSVILPKSIKIKNIKNLDTITDATSSFMPQKGSYSNATSSFMPQKGGNFVNSNKDINQLLSMLSATSHDNYTTNSTDTEQLKNKLFNILQEGGNAIADYEHSDIDVINGYNENEVESLNFNIDRYTKYQSIRIISENNYLEILYIITNHPDKNWYIFFLYVTFKRLNLPTRLKFIEVIIGYLYYIRDNSVNLMPQNNPVFFQSLINIFKKIVYEGSDRYLPINPYQDLFGDTFYNENRLMYDGLPSAIPDPSDRLPRLSDRPPRPPTRVSATAGDEKAIVSWSIPENDGGSAIISYIVTSSPEGITETVSGSTTTTATVEGLTNGTAYTFTVVATNAVGPSSSSAASDPVTPLTPRRSERIRDRDRDRASNPIPPSDPIPTLNPISYSGLLGSINPLSWFPGHSSTPIRAPTPTPSPPIRAPTPILASNVDPLLGFDPLSWFASPGSTPIRAPTPIPASIPP
jgi:hypothetical protein